MMPGNETTTPQALSADRARLSRLFRDTIAARMTSRRVWGADFYYLPPANWRPGAGFGYGPSSKKVWLRSRL